MRRAVATLAVLALVGCGDEPGGGEPSDSAGEPDRQEASTPKCRKAPRVLVASLDDTLTAQGGGKLRRVYSVRVDDPPSDPPLNGFNEGVYVVSAQLDAPRADGEVISWAISREMHKTGGGAGLGIGAVTREFSELGAAANPGSPVADYTDSLEATDAYEHSRKCAEGSS